jgi:DNA modification methylase
MHGDCLELMKTIPDKSIDMVLTDPPYGTTACKWDNVIPFGPMWTELKRVTKPNAAICLFGMEPFSSHLRISNIKMFKYDWIWKKSHAKGFLNAWKQPLRNTEIISIFYAKQCLYNPIIEDKKKENIRPHSVRTKLSDNYGKFNLSTHKLPHDKTMPKTVLDFNTCQGGLHPTQKPIPLLEYLIRTYTLESETVLDFTMGSGSTGVACLNLNRNFIGIEKDDNYFKISQDRIEKAKHK